MSHEVPYVAKKDVTVLAVGDPFEAAAVRAILEGFNYRVTVHWIGSRKELLKILSGDIPTDQTLILSCHGVAEGIVIPDEPVLTAEEVGAAAKLDGKTIVNLGCLTGSSVFTQAFKKAGVQEYIAPIDYPDGKAAIGFVSNLFLLLADEVGLSSAVNRASNFDVEMQQFKLAQ